jgi:hypothetical protein
MESQSKHSIHCDNCKVAVRLPTKGKKTPEEKASEPQPLEASLEDGLGNPKDYHFCDEECLRVFLNSRRKKAKASIEIDFSNNSFRKLVEEI